MRLKEISEENRPRERLELQGVSALSDSELLAIVLQNGYRGENVVDLCNRVISTVGLGNLSKSSLLELQKIRGIGKAKACQIIALFELNRRIKYSKNKGLPITSARKVYEYALPKLDGKKREYFMILLLDSKNCILKEEIVSVGTLNSAIIHPREIFKSAIKESANSVIVVHNHPSGDPEPSNEDKKITKKLFSAGDLIGIKVLDHVIVGDRTYYSFKDNL